MRGLGLHYRHVQQPQHLDDVARGATYDK